MNKKRFYFSCFTVYHLFVALYYASKVQSSNVSCVLIWFEKDDVNVNKYSNLFDEIYVIEREKGKFYKYWLRIKTSGYLAGSYYKHSLNKQSPNDVLFVFSDEHQATWRLMNVFKKQGCKIVLVEEGIGTYAFHKHSFSHKVLLSELIFGCRGENNIGVSPYIDSYIVKKPDALPKSKHKGRPVIQQNTMFDDKTWIEGLGVLNNNKTKAELNKFNDQRILWLGQPLSSCGVDLKTEIGVSNKIIKSLPSDYTTIIKKHPRDQIKKYDYINGNSVSKYFVNHDTWIPVEVLAGMINPGIIISPLSSAGTNLYDLGYGNKVIFCYKLFGISIDESWLEKYKDNKDIYNVSSFEELRAVIKEIQASPERINKKSMTINENKDIDYLNSLLSGSVK